MDDAIEFQSPIAPVICSFLSLKIALGRRYDTERRLLRLFDGFLVADNAIDLTAEVFERWCQTRTHLKSGVRRDQMLIVRKLCLYRRRRKPDCFVPDLALFPGAHQPITPYCFSNDDIARLIAAANRLPSNQAYPLRARVFRLAIVLLYTAGLRRGELVKLTIGDYDPRTESVFVQSSKFRKSRHLPLSADAVRELNEYLSVRRTYRCESMGAAAPLLWRGGAVVCGYTGPGFGVVFRKLTKTAGIRKADGQPPRVHDVRHSFAVNALLRWYQERKDVQAKLPLLSAYMGHSCVASTQYYLRFVEPLATLASERFAEHYGELVQPVREEKS